MINSPEDESPVTERGKGGREEEERTHRQYSKKLTE